MNNMVEIEFEDNEQDFIECQEFFNQLGQQALYMTHYELAEATDISPITWKKFLMDPRVAAFIAEEMELLKKTKVALMLNTVDTNKNTGQAQLLNTLLNQTKGSEKKEGPVFIYTQIPLNDQEVHAENVVVLNEDKSSTNTNE